MKSRKLQTIGLLCLAVWGGLFNIDSTSGIRLFGIEAYGQEENGASKAEPSVVSIGSTIPSVEFKDIRALTRRLHEFGKHRAIVMVFTTQSCPLVRKSFPKLIELQKQFADQDVLFVAVNVGADDTIGDMCSQAIEFDVPFLFVKDHKHELVSTLGVKRTPEVALLDGEFRLRYRGRIDDQLRLGGARPEPTRRDLEEALRELLAGKEVSVPETPVDGCLITPIESVDNRGYSLRYAEHIDSIIAAKCRNCHQENSAAPFALESYEDVVAQAEMIAEVVADERMPPWFAHPSHGSFQNDSSLTTSEKSTLLHWLASDRLAGDLQSLPVKEKKELSKWKIGEPDLVISMLEQHEVPETGFVPYKYTVLPHLFLGETWIEAVEIRPDNPAVVHHCNMAYVSSQGVGEETFITGYVPGGQPLDLGRFDNGVAYKIPGGSGLGLQIHYTTTGRKEKCRIEVGIRFPKRRVKKQFDHFLLDPRGWKIAPNDPAFAIRSSHTLQKDITLLGMFSHMHVRGRDMTFRAIDPQGTSKTLLQIANYNFEWQLGYEVKPGDVRLPKGTRLEAIAHFDNSPFNPYNPDATRAVPYGQQTYDEMFNGFVFFVRDDEELDLQVSPKSGRVLTPAKR